MDYFANGSRMWKAIGLVVLCWDIPALLSPTGQTGSDWYYEQLTRHPLLVGGLTLLLVLHLVKRPQRLSRYDPIGLMARAVSLIERGLASA